ncbi:MAG: hypothetical protein JNN12_05100 [Bacteroidetes Order II. Incertae sedis bacterium]|nr:hypothetical protein [Bacteroidetes Order II. bacterium]
MKKMIFCLFWVFASQIQAQAVTCLNEEVQVVNQSGWINRANQPTYCTFDRGEDFTSYSAMLRKAEAAFPDVRALAENVLSNIRAETGVENVRILRNGYYNENPLTDFFIELTYAKNIRVGHDLRTVYVHKLIYAFAKDGEVQTPYYAEVGTSTELPGNVVSTRFTAESPRFFAFIQSIRFPVVSSVVPRTINPKVVKVPQGIKTPPKQPLRIPPRPGN